MGELRVVFAGRATTIRQEESLGFGRSNRTPGQTMGWGYPGRFLELGPDPSIHRVWGEVTWRHGLWCVVALGQRHPVQVVLAGLAPIELSAHTEDSRRSGAAPELLAIAQSRFDIHLEVGPATFDLRCDASADGADPPAELPRPLNGEVTADVGSHVLEGITLAEYRVLRAMARDFIEGTTDGSLPKPLTYARVRNVLDLETERQAVSAVERIVRRFREGGLLATSVDANSQRRVVCELAVRYGMIERLDRKYADGPVVVS